MSWVIRDKFSFNKRSYMYVAGHELDIVDSYKSMILDIDELSRAKKFTTKQHALGYKGGLLRVLKKINDIGMYDDLKENLEVVNMDDL